MAHSYKTSNTTFLYNSDLSGNVTIRSGQQFLDVPGSDLLEFIIQYLKKEHISKVEEMSNQEFISQLKL